MKLFVLNYLCEYTDYPCEMYCMGVFDSREKAREKMESLFKAKMNEWITDFNYDEEDFEVTDLGNIMKLFNVVNNIDYIRYEIFEMEVE